MLKTHVVLVSKLSIHRSDQPFAEERGADSNAEANVDVEGDAEVDAHSDKLHNKGIEIEVTDGA